MGYDFRDFFRRCGIVQIDKRIVVLILIARVNGLCQTGVCNVAAASHIHSGIVARNRTGGGETDTAGCVFFIQTGQDVRDFGFGHSGIFHRNIKLFGLAAVTGDLAIEIEIYNRLFIQRGGDNLHSAIHAGHR